MDGAVRSAVKSKIMLWIVKLWWQLCTVKVRYLVGVAARPFPGTRWVGIWVLVVTNRWDCHVMYILRVTVTSWVVAAAWQGRRQGAASKTTKGGPFFSMKTTKFSTQNPKFWNFLGVPLPIPYPWARRPGLGAGTRQPPWNSPDCLHACSMLGCADSPCPSTSWQYRVMRQMPLS